MAARQETLKGVVPPLTVVQEAALLFLEAEDEAKRAKERANKRKDEMIQSASKAKTDLIKVRDASGKMHVFNLSSKAQVKHTKYEDVKIEVASKD